MGMCDPLDPCSECIKAREQIKRDRYRQVVYDPETGRYSDPKPRKSDREQTRDLDAFMRRAVAYGGTDKPSNAEILGIDVRPLSDWGHMNPKNANLLMLFERERYGRWQNEKPR